MADVQEAGDASHSATETEDEKSAAAEADPVSEFVKPSLLSSNAKHTPSKKSTPAKPPSSPKISYIQLVQEAIVEMKDRTGSSQVAIQKYIMANHPEVPEDKLKQRLLHTLKTGCANKRLLKVKASYKIHPDVKKKAAARKKKAVKKPPAKKSLSKEDVAALREKERKEAKEKERLDRIRKRKFPMDDLELIKEDKELKVTVELPSRPTLSLVMPEFPVVCKSDSVGSGLLDDAFHIYHFFRGDVGWGRFPKNKDIVAPFTLEQWLECIKQVLRGGAKKSRMLPPLMTHLFVVALQHLVPKELQAGLTPTSWSEVLMLYMDAMERYYTTEASANPEAQPGVGIDVEYLLLRRDDERDETLLPPLTLRETNFYLTGSLGKIQSKLFLNDPWVLSAEELLTLLKTLADDMLATQPECAEEMDLRVEETYELLKKKREADANFRKLQARKRKEENEKKEAEEKGEKATRSNTKLPTVSDAQLESARRQQQKATDAYEKACRSQRIRTEALGEDRHFHAVYHFWNDPERVYVAERAKGGSTQIPASTPEAPEIHRLAWHSINKRSDLEKYLESLDVRGKRECALKEALNLAVTSVEDDMKAMNDKKALLREKRDLQRQLENARMKCEVGRKSGRLAAQSEQELFDLQTEVENLEKAIAGEVKVEKTDLKVTTGLEMLRKFDAQIAEGPRRRTTRRDSQNQVPESDETRRPRLNCSKLWSTGNIDGTGSVGSFVWNLLELEERVEKLAKWESDRKAWISTLEIAAHSWHTSCPPVLEEERGSVSGAKSSPEPDSESKKQKHLNGESSSSLTLSVHQVLTMLKQPVLQLEKRIFQMTGLEVASRDAKEADDNMSTTSDDGEDKEEQLQLAWKKLIHRLHRLPSRAHSKIRHLVVDAIAAARKAQQPAVVFELREALLQFHPEAAGACKMAAIGILERHGGYDDEEEDEEDDEEEEQDEVKVDEQPEQSVEGLSSVLSFEGVILNSSLDGHEDATRSDWADAVKKCKTVAKLSALVASFCTKASKKLEKIEAEQDALSEAIAAWKRTTSVRKKSNQPDRERSEVWTHVSFTDEFCLAKVEDYPWWPGKKCVVKDEKIAAALESLDRTMVSLIGESGGLRVVTKDGIRPYSETSPDDEDLSAHPKEIRSQLEECKAMARRIVRGKRKLAQTGSNKRKSRSTEMEGLKDEKKIGS